MLHEPLDALEAAAVAVAEPLGERRLAVEREPLLGPAGKEVQMAAHGPQEVLAAPERRLLVAR